MHVLVTGAYGLIGSAIVARLLMEGHDVTGTGRHVDAAARKYPGVRWMVADFGKMTHAADWEKQITNVDAVVNCAGLLQSAPGNDLQDVHVRGTVALFEACERFGVRRVVHISAIGVDREQPTEFSETKRIADDDLMKRDLDWIILRPSVVLGRAAYGGSALFRSLAALPAFVPKFEKTAPLQVVQLDDVVRTVSFFLQPDAPVKCVVELAGPDRLTMTDVILAYRRWLGLPRPRLLRVPSGLQAPMFRLGDLVGLLGWRPPIRSTARQEIERGATGDPKPWQQLTGLAPRSLEQALREEPASVQEKWFARLYLLKPVIIGILALFWLVTGVLAIGPGYMYGKALLKEGGLEGTIVPLIIIGGALMDLAIGVGIVVRHTTRMALQASMGVAVFYAVIGTILVPRLWIDPLGPMVKIWPIIVLTLVALAILDDR
jgi:uncharacterized protein YbjT (DUF2867 family)